MTRGGIKWVALAAVGAALVGCGADTGKYHMTGRAQRPRIGGELCGNAETFHRKLERRDVRAAAVDDGNCVRHSVPFVLGSSEPSIRIA